MFNLVCFGTGGDGRVTLYPPEQMQDSRYDRSCPRCETTFSAVTERGVCPNCRLFFRRDRDGQLVGIVPVFEGGQFDWGLEPVDELGDAMFETVHFGGGPIFQSDRNDGYPDVELVHAQLEEKFRNITESIRPHLPDATLFDDESDTLPECYDNAVSIQLVSWDHGDKHYQLICYLTSDGGSIDVVIDRNADWHSNGG